MSGDKVTRFLTGLAVLAVAVIAAVVSFSHVESLALAHGQPLVDARLLPLSVDGLLVVSSLVLLAEARAQRPAPGLARAGLVLGVVATVAANIAFGARFGVIGAIVSGWPAVSFVVSTETLLSWVRRAGVYPTVADPAEAVATPVPADVPGITPVAVPTGTVSPTPTARPGTVSAPRARRRARSKQPEHVFSAELERGELPSVRAVKSRMHVGTDRARAVREQLQNSMTGQEVLSDV